MKTKYMTLLILFLFHSILFSQGIPYGQEFRVTPQKRCSHSHPFVATLANGSFVVCWELGDFEDSQCGGIFAQLFDSTGNKIDNEIKVNTYSEGYHAEPIVYALQNEGFVVCWGSKGQDGSYWDISAQLFDKIGNKIGNEFQVNTYKTSNQWEPCICILSNGCFVVCWSSTGQDGSGWGIFAQRFDRLGNKVESEFQINTYTISDQFQPVVSTLQNTGFVVCWTSRGQDGSDWGIFAHLFDENGNKIGSEIRVNTYRNKNQCKPAISTLQNGDFIICWESEQKDGSGYGIFAQRFNATGNKVESEFQVNTYTNGDQTQPFVSALSNGSFIICWVSYGQDGSGYGVFAQIFDAMCNKIGNEFQVNTYTDHHQCYPSIALLHNGRYVITWLSKNQGGGGGGVFGTIFPEEPKYHPLNAFSLIEPQTEDILSTTQAIFKWQRPNSDIKVYPWEITFGLCIDTVFNSLNPQHIKGIEDTSYAIKDLTPGKIYYWKVQAKNFSGDSLWSTQQNWCFYIRQSLTGVTEQQPELPHNFVLYQNYPNPFNPVTEIKYALPDGASSFRVTIKIYDVLGRLVKVLVDAEKASGVHSVRWDSTDLLDQPVASGVYFYSLEVGEFKEMKKMLLLR